MKGVAVKLSYDRCVGIVQRVTGTIVIIPMPIMRSLHKGDPITWHLHLNYATGSLG